MQTLEDFFDKLSEIGKIWAEWKWGKERFFADFGEISCIYAIFVVPLQQN